jgi:MFS family permease
MVHDIPSIANRADWGLVLGCFKWTYAVLSPFGGYIADRFSKRYVIGGSLLVWSMVTWWTGHVSTFHELMAARALMGISEAFYIPAALALISEYHLGPTRSRAVGVHQAGIYVGQILGGFAGYMADSPDHGWRWMFSTCGMIGVIYAIPLAPPCAIPCAALRRWPKPPPPRPAWRSAACWATATSSCSSPTSRCPPSPVGWCATGCRKSCARNSPSAKARPASARSSTCRLPRSSARSSAARWRIVG